jgi:hypothetical protein
MDAYIIILSLIVLSSFIGVIYYLKTNDEFKGPQGIPGPLGPIGKPGADSVIHGPPGKNGEVTYDFMKKNTLWCADSDLCDVPSDKIGLHFGPVKLFNTKNAKGEISDFNISSNNNINIVVDDTNTMSITKGKVFIKQRDILAELDDLKKYIVRTDKKYGVISSKGGYLSDQGQAGAAWKSRPTLLRDPEVMSFDEIKN